MLGPEGGFSEQEIAAARDQGWQSVSLGKQVLRAETATIAATLNRSASSWKDVR